MKKGCAMTATAMKGKMIAFEYSVRSEDNRVVDSNVGKAPFVYTQGTNQVIPGLESAVEGMLVGDIKQVVFLLWTVLVSTTRTQSRRWTREGFRGTSRSEHSSA